MTGKKDSSTMQRALFPNKFSPVAVKVCDRFVCVVRPRQGPTETGRKEKPTSRKDRLHHRPIMSNMTGQ